MCQYKIETNTNKLILIQNHFPMYVWYVCVCLNELKFEISSRLILLNVKLIWKLHENLTGNVPENFVAHCLLNEIGIYSLPKINAPEMNVMMGPRTAHTLSILCYSMVHLGLCFWSIKSKVFWAIIYWMNLPLFFAWFCCQTKIQWNRNVMDMFHRWSSILVKI